MIDSSSPLSYSLSMGRSAANRLGERRECSQFQTTHWSVVLAAGEQNSAEFSGALETLCRTYWTPIYAFIRRSGTDHHRAQDLTQDFFARLLARRGLDGLCPERGRFRSFLLVSLKNFLSNERVRSAAQKRGGGRRLFSLDEFLTEEDRACWPADQLSPDRLFDRRWAIAIFESALARLRLEYLAVGRERHFDALKAYLTDERADVSQAELAHDLQLTPGTVKQVVHQMRKRYREVLRDQVAQTVAEPNDINAELAELIAALRS